jgi:ribose/xylose/arabinose/galactoside ABC-type transport system permease subunit
VTLPIRTELRVSCDAPRYDVALSQSTCCGLVNGSLIVYGKLPPFVATLAMLGIARGLLLLYTDGRPLPNISRAYTFWGRGQVKLPIFG